MLLRRVPFALVILTLMLPSLVLGQQGSKMRIENAGFLKLEKQDGRSVQRLVGNVILRQDSTLFYCDSAALDDRNNIQANGNVHIIQNDSIELFGKYLRYDGNNRIAVLDSNVKLVDNRATLYTEHLTYERGPKVAYYNQFGRIVDQENVLTSITGRYYTVSNEFFFKDSVVVTNPDYTMYADTLRYNTETEVVFIEGPTWIIGEKDRIYSEKGWYDTQTDKSELNKNNLIIHEAQKISGRTIFYDRERGYGRAVEEVMLADTSRDVIINGWQGEFFKERGYGYVTGMARAILVDGDDSLFLHADTFRIVLDSADKAKYILAYRHMKFFREDLQGMCDSLVYDAADSVITMMGEPVLWSDNNQLTADSIRIYVSGNRIDSLILHQSALIVSRDSTSSFNQIKGKQMRGYVLDGELRRIRVLGNAETIYYVREDDDGSLIGINVALASDMGIDIGEKKVQIITYYTKPDATLFPEAELPETARWLKGFKWIEGQRPMRKEEIFFWRD
jgi:lipopolysaccharide export system protein LptA